MKNTNEPYYMKNPPVSNKNDMTDKLDNSTKNLSKVIEQTKFVISNNLDLDFSKLSLIDNKKKVDLNMVDPKTPEIKTICESLIGSKINIGFTITLQNGENQFVCYCKNLYLEVNLELSGLQLGSC